MSAVFTGNGLGLFNTSLTQLGTSVGGGAGVGQGGDRHYVNLATGNLVWQSQDEHLVFRGLAVGLNRTYNSLGQLSEMGADGWVTGFERRVGLLSGTFNSAGSVMRRYTGDGAYQDFTYVAPHQYRSTGGDGAHDTLSWSGSAWTYVEGSTRREEGYADHADGVQQGRLTHVRQLRSDGTTPVTWQVVYDAQQRIAEVRADDGTGTGDALVFGYDGSGRLSSIATREAGVVRHQVAYGYDGQGRLTSVLTDLTPGDTADNAWNASAAANDGRLFRTQYTYEGTSLRLASVAQSDGTLVSYTYHADGRLKTVTRGDTNANDADGAGQTLTYTYDSGSTTVADSLGRSWVYGFDAAGQLTSLTAPAVSGQSDVTTYQYDSAGNLTQAKTVRGATTLSQVDYAYDAAGNVTWEWDAQGNALSRTWSASNQLLSLTQYTGVDPDRTGAGLPTGGMTTRYVYDAQDRLRFVMDALGQVSEFSYATSGHGIGQQSAVRQYLGASYSGTYDLAGLQAWATAAQKANSQLSELGYDAWGRLSQRTDYATVNASGAGVLDAATQVSRYTYDAQGLLRQQSTLRGAGRTVEGAALAGSQQVVYAYDGLGRLMSTTQREVGSTDTDTTTIHTTYAYLDSGHQVQVTEDAGRILLQTRNAAGQLISVSEQGMAGGSAQTRTQVNTYDAAGQLRASQDAAGGRTYFFYDAKGRLEATVDATGAVSRTTYDGADRVVGTRQYANRVTTTSWLVDGSVVPTSVSAVALVANDALDRVSGRTYDAAGRLLTQTDGLESSSARAITTYSYDGAGRLLQARTTDAAGTAATARLVRYFYDEAGRQVGTLDAAGYLTETQYNRAGQVVAQTRYATASPSAQWASGTLAQLRPAVNAGQDQVTRYYYDGRGNQVGVLDAQGYLTEWVVDEAGHARAERRYATALTWAGTDTLATLRSRAGTYREQRMAYNALGQLATQVNAEGTVTRYTYDEAGRLVKTELAQGTSEVREGHRRYNAFNELIGELSGEGALQVLPGMTEAQLDAVYAQHGVRHGYDVMGRRIESVDAAGNKTWYFYDAAGRQSFTVRGVADSGNVANALGEVTEARYNAFGQVSESLTYTGRITLAVPGSRASAQAAVSVLSYMAATDTRRQFTYTARGQVASTTGAEGGLTQYSYDAFGQLSQQVTAAGTGAASTSDFVYDKRGLQTQVREGVGTASERITGQAYDAFGRLTSTTDARGAVRSVSYDRLGRQLAVTQLVRGLTESTSTTYDAYGRVVSVTDAESKVTTYVHDDAARSLTVTSPEGVVVTTVHNRHGQTVTVTNALGQATTYAYNRDGRLTRTTDNLNQVATSEYDARGLLTATVDGSGRRVEWRYDAAGRVLQRVEDPSGAARTTAYAYDGQGRQLTVTDPSGRVTGYRYDREGRLLETAQDPAGLNLRTQYVYDAAGRQVSVTEGAGTAAARTTQYGYDVLGRRISEVVDPGTGKLNLTTSYAYDTNDNVIRRTDANGATTRFYYDEANRLTYTVDPLGGMTKQWYDRTGRMVAVRHFTQATNAATLTDTDTLAQLNVRLTWNAGDRGHYRIYDGDGRLHFVLDISGALTEHRYDAAGRQVATRGYAAAYSPSSGLQDALFDGSAEPSQIQPVANDARDQRTYQVLDAAGRARFIVDGLGNTQELHYDAANRLVGTRRYAAAIALDATLRARLEAGTTLLADITTKLSVSAERDQVEYRVHDAAGRLRYTIDAIGAVRVTLTDAAGQVIGSRAYGTPVTVSSALKTKLQAGTATAADIETLLTAAIVDDARNQEQFQVRDAAGRVRFTVAVLKDAAGAITGLVSELRYEAAGRVTEQLRYETPVAAATLTAQLAALRAGTVGATTVAGWVGGAVRATYLVHDAAGRVRYTLQADTASTLTVSERRYDAVGRVVAELAYAVTVASATAKTVAAVAAAVIAAGGDNATQQRLTRFVHDSNGQVRFRIDDAGAVTETRYDALGRLVQTRQYALLLPAGTAATESAMAAAVAGQGGANVRITQTAYNAAGQVASVTDAAGKTESYGYDALGQRTTLTNKLGHVWTYAYDAAGRLVEETSPPVTLASATVAGAVTTSTRTVKTVLAYDALGHLLSRTEDATGAQPRTTQYQYDSRGNQIRTLFADAWQLNPATGQLEATGQAPSIEVTYDALGQAVVQKDVRGHYSYKVYDTLGRLAYDIDPEGYASSYTYNAFGEQSQLRRYASKANLAGIAGFSAGTAVQLSQLSASVLVANAAQDRVLTTRYDHRGLKTEVQQSVITYIKTDGTTATGAPTTQFAYTAFGELARTSVLLDLAANRWAHTYQYYDELGRNTLNVDAEGHVTQVQYNALNEVVLSREYARALTPALVAGLTVQAPPPPPAAGDAVSGYDRVMEYSYDAMGRKVSERVLRHYARADGSPGLRPVETAWTYDAAGQVVRLKVDTQETKTVYDALGRVSSVEEAAQQRLVATAEGQLLGTTAIGLGTQSLYAWVSPYMAMAYDAFGNLVRVTRYANGLSAGQGAPAADAANDQVSVTLYDRQGRAVMSRDAEGHQVFLQYDAADHVVHSWYALSGNDGRNTTVHSYYTYDGAGRQLSSRTQRDGASAPDQREAVRYNAFGEIIAKGDDDTPGAALQAQYEYDLAGNLVRSNAEGGAWRDYGYNLAGHQLREARSVYVGPGHVTAVTRYVTDRLGRTVQMVLPSHTQNPAELNYLSQTRDRWGNVIAQVDPNGYQTTYQYNDRDQLVKETRPLVKVVISNAAGTWQRPELTWSYDELGRLVASRDANGNTTRYEYDGAGKQIKVIDANGSVTLTAYDALGRARLTQNALGYATFKQYDRLDRVTAHGDYLPTASGSTRSKKTLESYVLNQNGQRLQVANGMAQTSQYDYDSRGLLLRSQTPMGVVMEYGYDLGGRRSLERYALSHANVVDRDGETVRTNEQSWDYDYFGRLIDRNDLSGRDYDYSYDAASGQLTSETNSSGLNRTTLYTVNGLVREIQEPNGTVFRYAYDQAGNRILEEAVVRDSRGKQFNVRTHIVYDSHHRLQRVVQDDVLTSQRVFELSYDYDAAGNRTHVVARTGYGENTAPIVALDHAPVVIGLPADRVIRTGVASTFRVRLTDIFRDPEGKPLSVTASQVVNGAATGLPGWLSYTVDAGTGEAVFTATSGSSAADNQNFTVRLTASDGTSSTAVNFSLSVRANTAPTDKAGAVTSVPVKTGKPWALELAVDDYFTDPDVGDSLRLGVSVSPAAAWLSIDTSHPSVTRLSATAPVAGTYTLTLTATDQLGATQTRTVTLVVAANAAPTVVAPVPNQTATLGRGYLLERNLAAVFQDGHDDTLNVTASLTNGQALPSWLSFQFLSDQAVPTLMFGGQVPTDIPDGTVYQVRLIAIDSDGASSYTDFTVTVRANRAPDAVGTPAAQSLRINDDFSLNLPIASLFIDPEGDILNFELLHPSGTKSDWLRLQVDREAGVLRLTGKPTHNTLHIGSYQVQIRARDTEGLTRTVNIGFNVSGDNAPIRNSAVALHDSTVKIGRSFSITLPENLFTDADGDQIALYPELAFQDEMWIDHIPPYTVYSVVTAPLPAWMSYNPATRTLSGVVPGNLSAHSFVIRVSASDGRKFASLGDMLGGPNQTYDADITVHVVPFSNSAPIYHANTLPARNLVHGSAVDFALPAGAFTEPDGDALSYTAQVQVGSSWVNLSQLGLSINTSTGRITGTAVNLTQASYNARIIASDPQGAQAIGTFVFGVNNTPPTAVAIPEQSVGRNVAASLALALFFSDVNQNVLTFTATGLPTGLSLSSAGVITGSTGVALGNYTVTVTANDGRGGTVSQSFTLTVANSAPTAPAIPNQTASAGSNWSYPIPAFTDPNGDTLTYTVTGMPAWMSFNASGRTLSGTPAPVGSWTITVTATDTAGASVSQAFTVTTPNVAPVVVTAIGTQSVGRNMPWSFQVPANTFRDDNNDALTYSTGTLPNGISFNATTRTFSGTPTALGNHTLTVTVSDGNGGTRSTSFVLSVVNNPPIYHGGVVNRVGQRAQTVSWSLPAGTFTDPNQDGLTYSLWVLRPSYEQYYEPTPGGALEVRTIQAEWFPAANYSFNINPATGAITGTAYPMILESGTSQMQGQLINDYTLKIIASDGHGGSAEASFNLHVNEAPTGHVYNQAVKSHVAWSFQIPAFSDPNHDPLTYSVSGLPAGLSFNPANRVISGTPTSPGTYSVTVTVSDGMGGVNAFPFTLTVHANNAPTAPGLPNLTGTAGTALGYTLPEFSDANYDALSYSATGLPPGMWFDPGSRTIGGTPSSAGTWLVTYTANDNRGGVTSAQFHITINPEPIPNRAPYVNVPQNQVYHHFHSTNRWLVPVEGFVVPVNAFIDPDSNPMTYTILQKPSWLTYNYVGGSGHQFSGVNNDSSPYNTHTIQIRATDPSGLSAVLTLYVTSSFDYYDPGNPTDPLSMPEGPVQMFMASAEEPEAETPSASPPLMQAMGGTNVVEQSRWFAYDKMNRMTVSGGVVENNQVVVAKLGGTQSFGVSYDAVGNQVAQYQWRGNGSSWWTTIVQQTYSLRGELLLTFNETRLGEGSTPLEKRSYDDAGRLTQVLSYYGPTQYIWVQQGDDAEYYVDVTGWLRAAETRSYDADGRVTAVTTRTRSDQWMSRNPTGQREYSFPVWIDGLMGYGGDEQSTDLGVLPVISTVSYQGAGKGYDAAGRLVGYSYTDGTAGYTHTYTYAYAGWDSYREQTVTGSSTNSNYKTTTSTMTFDAAGRQTEIREKTNGVTIDDRVRTFAFDGGGQLLSRRDGTVTSSNVFQQKGSNGQAATGAALGRMNLHNVYANGQQVAGLDEAGKLDVLSRLTAFSNTDSGRTQVTVQAGDSLRSIAQRVYGNASLWYVIAEANALNGDGDLVAGTTLTVPEVKTSANDANTFKPYNPGEITGPTSPGLPYIAPPSGGGGCGVLGMIIMVVVIVVVTIYTAGAATAAVGSSFGSIMGAGASALATGSISAGAAFAAGVAGNVAGQLVGNAVGVRDGFSIKEALVGGITTVAAAGVAGAISEAAQAGSTAAQLLGNAWVRGAAGAVAANVANYGANKAVGNDVSFSWRNVAASAVSGAISAQLSSGLVKGLDISSEFGRQLTHGFVGGIVGVHTRRSLGFDESINYQTIAADAFGNALANSMVERAASGPASREASLTNQATVAAAGHFSALGLDPSAFPMNEFAPATQLDTVVVYPNEQDTRDAWSEWVWRMDFNAWAGAGNGRIPAGASTEQARAIYSAARAQWHESRSGQRYAAVQVAASASWTNGYGSGGAQSSEWRMQGVQDSTARLGPAGYHNSAGQIEFKPLGFAKLGQKLVAGWNGFADAYNAQGRSNGQWMAGLDLPFTDKTLGETGFGQRLVSQIPQMPHWNGHGVAQALVPGITGWVDSGFALPESPLDLWKGQWKGGLNLLSNTVEGLSNLSPINNLTYLATGYRTDLPSFDIPARQQLGAAAFDVGAVALSVLAPEARLTELGRARSIANGTRLNVLEGSGSAIRLDGHKIYDPAFSPLSTNPSAQYRFSDPTFRPTGGDVYFGENLATSYFEVRKNVGGKSLFVSDLRLENMLDMTDPDVLKRMNIDQSRLMARVDNPLDQKAVYGYTNQISNEAFAAGYNGIIYQSTRGPGSAVVLFGGRYDPKTIVPIIDVQLP